MIFLFHIGIAIAALLVVALMTRSLRTSSPRLHVGLLALVPLLLIGLYHSIGTPAALLDKNRIPPVPADITPEDFAEAIDELRRELERNPEQPEGWVLLARAHGARQEHDKAREAFHKALGFAPDDTGLMVEAAQASAQADPEKRFDDEALALLQRSVTLRPDNQRGHWFLGIAQRQRGLHAEAARSWERILPQLEAGTAQSLLTQINEARAAAGEPPLDATAPQEVVAGLHAIQIRLDVDASLRARHPQATVFVIARQPGAPMPVAVKRFPVSAVPASIVLDDADGPMPTQRLSDVQDVEVFARLSLTGSANRSDDDIESVVHPIGLPASAPLRLSLTER